MRAYEKPVITVDSGMAEGIYAASGATQGTLNVTYYGQMGYKWRKRFGYGRLVRN